MVQIIKLTKDFETIVDDDLYELLTNRHGKEQKWRAANWRNAHYAVMTYCEPRSAKRGDISMHNLVHWIAYQDRRIFEAAWTVDHINNQALDNRSANLRLASRREQVLNQNLRSDNRSGLTCISRDTKKLKWFVAFKALGNTQQVGRYDCKLQALLEYKRAYRDIHDRDPYF